jgi:predicted permease
LVVLQLSLALVLLVGSGLTMRSFLHLQKSDPGIDASNVLTFRVGLPSTQFTDKPAVRAFWQRLLANLKTIPGVEAAGVVSYLPVAENYDFNAFFIEGRPTPATVYASLAALERTATPGVFDVLRIPVLKGRGILDSDTFEAAPVVVVDAFFAEKFFPGEDPIGHRINMDSPDGSMRIWRTIVGVVGNVRQFPTATKPEPSVWLPLAQAHENFSSGLIRVKSAPLAYERAVQAAVTAAQPGIPIYTVKSMDAILRESYWHERFFGQLFLLFAVVALFLAAIGIYGVMAYSVAQREQEIGVRMALGAPPREVMRMILAKGLRLIAAGLALGFAGAWFVARLLAGNLHGISPHDPSTFALVSLVLAAVALVACYLPSRRATRVDPIQALRTDC